MFLDKQYKVSELFYAPLVQILEKKYNNDGYVHCKSNIYRVGIFKRIGSDKFLHLSTGILLEKLTSLCVEGEFYVDMQKGSYLSFIMKDPTIPTLPLKVILEIEKKLNEDFNNEKLNENNNEMTK